MYVDVSWHMVKQCQHMTVSLGLVGPVVGPLVAPVVGPDLGPVLGQVIGPVLGPEVGPGISALDGPVVGPGIGPFSFGTSSKRSCKAWLWCCDSASFK